MTGTTIVCLRCEQTVTADAMTEQCPRSGGRRRTHEVLNPPEWRSGDPVRPGSSLHPTWCERSDPSPFVDPPCTCHCPPTGIVGAASRKSAGHSPAAQEAYDRAAEAVRRLKGVQS